MTRFFVRRLIRTRSTRRAWSEIRASLLSATGIIYNTTRAREANASECCVHTHTNQRFYTPSSTHHPSAFFDIPSILFMKRKRRVERDAGRDAERRSRGVTQLTSQRHGSKGPAGVGESLPRVCLLISERWPHATNAYLNATTHTANLNYLNY